MNELINFIVLFVAFGAWGTITFSLIIVIITILKSMD